MSKQRDWTKFISHSTAWLVAVLAVIAFTLSYNALQQVAYQYGVPDRLSYAWPLLVDFALIVFSMAVLTANLHGESAWRQWVLTGLFTVATIGFNLIHAPANSIARIVAIVAPIALFLSFETLMVMVKNGVKRNGLTLALKTLAGQVDTLRQELAQADTERKAILADISNRRKGIDEEIKAKRQKLDVLRQEYDNLLTETEKVRGDLDALKTQSPPKQANLDALLAYLAINPSATLTAAANEIGVSRQTVGNYVGELTAEGRLHKNGNGWEVKSQ